jgi:electron transfer flavoprotein beta subunit
VKILVTCKRVIDPYAKVKLTADKSGVDATGVDYKPNPFDENAVEEALKLVDKHGGEVVVLSLGSDDAASTIRTFLAMGAQRGILVKGVGDDGLDSDLAARIIAAVWKKESPDLLLMGKQAVDGDNNQVGQLVAEYLGLGQACFASAVAVSGNKATVTREVDGGLEVVEMDLPGVITADLRLNEPRYASLPGIMKARKKPIDEIDFASLGVDNRTLVRTVRFEEPAARSGKCTFVESTDDLVHKLKTEARAL